MIRSLDSGISQESSDRPKVHLTQEEFDLISSYSFPEDDDEKAKIAMLLDEKGIKVDSGDVDIEIDGVVSTITTVPHDFGTIVKINGENPPTIPHGFEDSK